MSTATSPSLAQSLRHLAVGRRPLWTFARILFLVLGTALALKYVVALRKIESTSMLPTFREGSVHVIYRLAYRPGNPPARGDIIAIRTSGETVMYVKRVIALPGETISILRGTVQINQQPLEEPYTSRRRAPWNLPARTLGPSEYYVIGDNRDMTLEQHELGAIEAERIVGKVVR
ncbi:MAG: signal peptidase I [Verrucomicrobiales bacterium]|nr:signal peptidase I [Verrucomicrobiales bacterium]